MKATVQSQLIIYRNLKKIAHCVNTSVYTHVDVKNLLNTIYIKYYLKYRRVVLYVRIWVIEAPCKKLILLSPLITFPECLN